MAVVRASSTKSSRRLSDEMQASPQPAPPRPLRAFRVRPAVALLLPVFFSGALGATVLLPGVAAEANARRSILGASLLVTAWAAAIFATSRRRKLVIEILLRRPHYLQLFVQSSLYTYWGWYWPEVSRWLPFLAAQLLFAYAIESVIAWTRRDTYAFGMGPFPIVLSTNLFLWFKPQWFYWQLALIALAFAAKEWIRWERDGSKACVQAVREESQDRGQEGCRGPGEGAHRRAAAWSRRESGRTPSSRRRSPI